MVDVTTFLVLDMRLGMVLAQYVNFLYMHSHLYHHKTDTQIYWPNFNCFQKYNSPVHNLLVGLLTELLFIYSLFMDPLQNKCLLQFLVFFSKTPIFIFTSKKSSQFVGKSLCGPFNNRGSIKKSECYHNLILSKIIFSELSPNLIISTSGEFFYSFHYCEQSRPIPQTWKTEQKAT